MAEGASHTVFSENRENIKLCGVMEVVSFDDREISLKTTCGDMIIEGENLHVGILNVDDGIIEVGGKIDGIYYFDEAPTQKKKLFGKSR